MNRAIIRGEKKFAAIALTLLIPVIMEEAAALTAFWRLISEMKRMVIK